MNPLQYFEDFLSIPRESGNEQKISNYLCEFARQHHLEYEVDDVYNVIIKKKSNCNSTETIILQGHTDMVCTSLEPYDFKKGIDWYISDGYYKAHNTTLGADNGIGCSIILALLADDSYQSPNIEAVFTTQEETTMEGAKRLNYAKLNGHKLISIDGTEEGVIEVSCAGMTSINLKRAINYVSNNKKTYTIMINNMLGGHSGVDIDKGHGNAIRVMADILKKINNAQLVSIAGGSKENVIPSSCTCVVVTDDTIKISDEYAKKYPQINITVKETIMSDKAMMKEDTDLIVAFLTKCPIDVLTYYQNFPQTSLNIGVISTDDKWVNIDISIRSSNIDDEKKYTDDIEDLATGFIFHLVDRKPFFSYQENSPLRDVLVQKYKDLYHKDVLLKSVHAGLEGGIFNQNIKDLDICVIAPNLYDIHTVNERVEIASVLRVYEWVKEVLKAL